LEAWEVCRMVGKAVSEYSAGSHKASKNP
jgi:hypothetical protein